MASDSESSKVEVYIYDISFGMARAMSQGILDKLMAYGILELLHSGKNISLEETLASLVALQGGTILGQPTQKIDLGTTEIPFDVFMDYLLELSQTTFKANTYHLFNHNCNNFSSEVAQFLTGNDIPQHITSLPQDVLSTPFGAMIQPFVEAMQVQGGHSPFQNS